MPESSQHWRCVGQGSHACRQCCTSRSLQVKIGAQELGGQPVTKDCKAEKVPTRLGVQGGETAIQYLLGHHCAS